MDENTAIPQQSDISQPAINEIPDVNPVNLPDTSLSVTERITRLEQELNIN